MTPKPLTLVLSTKPSISVALHPHALDTLLHLARSLHDAQHSTGRCHGNDYRSTQPQDILNLLLTHYSTISALNLLALANTLTEHSAYWGKPTTDLPAFTYNTSLIPTIVRDYADTALSIYCSANNMSATRFRAAMAAQFNFSPTSPLV